LSRLGLAEEQAKVVVELVEERPVADLRT